MKGILSLRIRLTAIILIPLLLIALIIGAWAYRDAQLRAGERFDLSLLSTALAISRDVALNGGDALSEQTRDLLRDTSGGSVFYHVYAPDGVFVTGYATPPVPPAGAIETAEQLTYFDARYQGQTVRVLRFVEGMLVDGLSGRFTFTVWQNTSLRDGFVLGRTQPTFAIIATLMAALGLIVWFGVRLGLRPLFDLQDAISSRSSNDLSPIRRAIPEEVKGIVGTLNALLRELSVTLQAKDDFISNAAHQLRNPIAGVLSLSEAVKSAKTLDDAKLRSADLVVAAKDTSALANSLLTLERAASPKGTDSAKVYDIGDLLQDTAHALAESCAAKGVSFTSRFADETLSQVDPILLQQAVLNLCNNALAHGGPALSSIDLTVAKDADLINITVTDDGIGMAPEDVPIALERFGQIRPAQGSGLGLPIAKAAAEAFGGSLDIDAKGPGLRISMRLPAVANPPAI